LIDSRFQRSDIGERAETISEVETVAHHPDVGDFKAEIVNVDIYLTPFRLTQENTAA
jgi:hypothetical protein